MRFRVGLYNDEGEFPEKASFPRNTGSWPLRGDQPLLCRVAVQTMHCNDNDEQPADKPYSAPTIRQAPRDLVSRCHISPLSLPMRWQPKGAHAALGPLAPQ